MRENSEGIHCCGLLDLAGVLTFQEDSSAMARGERQASRFQEPLEAKQSRGKQTRWNAGNSQSRGRFNTKVARREDGMKITRSMRLSKASERKLLYCLITAGILAIATRLLPASVGLCAEPANARLAILDSIGYDQANRSVSIVLRLSDQRPFRLGRLDAGLYIDIANARLSPQLQTNGTQLPSNSLVQVETQQLRKDTARVAIIFDSIARLQAVQLKDPSRILVEIELPDSPTETERPRRQQPLKFQARSKTKTSRTISSRRPLCPLSGVIRLTPKDLS
jgi:hypothetical protein